MYKLIRTLLPVLAAVIATTVSAQSVSWKSTVQHLDGQTYRIVLEASIPAPWHMYDMGPYEGGPNATTTKRSEWRSEPSPERRSSPKA